MRKLAFLLLTALALPAWPLRVQAAESAPPQPYTRIANLDSNIVQLQIALRKFVPAQGNGPTLWLAGVMHIGEPEYYHALQHFLETQTLVLYEGVNPDAHPRHVHDSSEAATRDTPSATPPSGTNAGYSMQSTLARSLGLVFQLEAIDYDRTNFLNSDLSVQQIEHIMERGQRPALPGETGATNMSFDALLQIMDGSSFLGSLVKMGMEFVATSPKLQAVAKLTLIEAVGRLKGDLSDVQGMPADWKRLLQVLIEARNQNLVSDLMEELKKIPPSGSIAVFYGAAHMDDMQKRITRDLHYRPADETWLSAFSVDMRQSGITPAEAQWLRTLIQGQIDQMQGH